MVQTLQISNNPGYKELEKVLGKVSEADKISSNLSQRDIESLVDLSYYAHCQALKYCAMHSGLSDPVHLGIVVASSYERNLLLSILTANAVVESKKILGRGPVVLELGMGSGINCVAALLADEKAEVIGIEKDEETIKFAEQLFKRYGVKDRIKIVHGDFLATDIGKSVDIVVNENLSTDLINEPLFPACNAALPYAHSKTLFVPGGVEIYASGFWNGSDVNLSQISFSNPPRSPIALKFEFQSNGEGVKCIEFPTRLLDYKGDIALKGPISKLNFAPMTVHLSQEIAPNSKYHFSLYLDYLSPKAYYNITPFY
ncbi:MAG TPA: methyltransferase domain-containing protein [Candidatus Nanoarchaeia archaeon]|nr:methyltransferase domain-containing protein [Candidatus Nanoarchaeia archaeon]